MYPWRRQRPSNELMSDIYDSPRWKRLFESSPPVDDRPTVVAIQVCVLCTIVVYYVVIIAVEHMSPALQVCVDGVPLCNRKELVTAKPLQAFIANLPPWSRYKAANMFVMASFPGSFKAKESRKYYNWSATFEMEDLYETGIHGVKVRVYGTSLDCPGRREQLHMQSVQAFYPCVHCLHTWQPGMRRQIYGGYRRFLPPNSPWRQKVFTYKGHNYMFRDVEVRQPPQPRTDYNVSVMASLGTVARPFCGHKGYRLLQRWPGVDWDGSFADIMHDLKCFCDMTLKGLVGTGSHGMYKSWGNKDVTHRADCKTYGIFNDFCSDPDSLPPWRLSKADVAEMNRRVCSMWWPHQMDKLCRNNKSFWTNRY